jgi:putative transposase
LRIEEVLTAPQSLWQNAYLERLIGSIRRERLNHFIVLNARHPKGTLAAYFLYRLKSRPHPAPQKQCRSMFHIRTLDPIHQGHASISGT